MSDINFLKAMEAVGLNVVVIDEDTDFDKLPRLTPPAPAVVPSPFLPDTNIQFAWDSTSLGDLKKCARYYQFIHIDGWTPKDNSIHLRFGIEYHEALHNYERCRAANIDHEGSVHDVVREILIRNHDYPDVSNGKPSIRVKSKANLVRTVVWYLDQFQDDPATTIQLRDETPAMEVSFRFELEWGPEEGARDLLTAPQPYILCGHLDRLVTFNDETFVMDRKTTTGSNQPSPYYFEQYGPSNQMTLYSLAGQIVLGTAIRGVIIDAAVVGPNASYFGRGFTYRTQGQLDEWLVDLQHWLRLAESYAIAGYWPQNDTACTMYGGCRFRDVCSKSPGIRPAMLAADFTQLPPEARWNPLKPR